MKRLAILGASGHGKVVADTAECCGWHEIKFFDDAWPKLQFNRKWQVVGDSAALFDQLHSFDGVVVAIGNNQVRHKKLLGLKAAEAHLVTLVHPAAVVSRYASLGNGTVIFAGTVVNTDVHIGIGAILNTGCSVDHDCILGNAVHISPGARLAGGVNVGDQSWIGIGSSVRQSINIGKRVMVGAGAVIINNIPDDVTVVGVPAKPI